MVEADMKDGSVINPKQNPGGSKAVPLAGNSGETLYSPAFLIMGLANFCVISSIGVFYLFPLYITQAGGSKTDIGLMMGAMALAAVLCRPWISEMVDRLGRKKSLTIGCLIMSILPLAYIFFSGDLSGFFFPLLLVRSAHGVGIATSFTALFTYICDIIPEDRLGEGLGMFGITGLAGMAAGPALAEPIIHYFGFTAYFLTGAVLGLMALLLHLPLPELYIRPTTPQPSFFSVFKQKKIILVTILAVLFGIGLAASSGFVSPYAQDHHIPFISVYFVCYAMAAILTRIFGGKLADRIGEEKIVPYALITASFGLFFVQIAKGIFLLGLAGFIFGCGHGFLFPCLSTLAIRHQPADRRGKINGIFTGGIDAGVFAGSIMLGYIAEMVGFQAVFLTSSLALLVGFTIYILLLSRWI